MLGRGVLPWLLRCWEGVIRSTALGQELSVGCNISIALLMVFFYGVVSPRMQVGRREFQNQGDDL
jgi:hypothetical protein